MASVAYPFSIRDNAANPPGTRKTGLTPTIVLAKNLSTGADVSAQLAVAEIGQGQYKITYDPEVNGDAACQLDAGSSLPNPADRYIDLALTREPSRIVTSLPVPNAGTVGGLPTGDGSGRVTVGAIAAGAITAATHATGAIDANAFSQAAADKVWSTATRSLTAFAFPVTASSVTDKTGYGLSSGERTSLATAVLTDVTDTLGAAIIAVKAKTDQLTFTGSTVNVTVGACAAGALTTAAFAAGATLPRVTLCDTVTVYTGNIPQTGDSYAELIRLRGVAITGTVAPSPTPSASGFTVTLDAPLDAASVAATFVNLYLEFATGPLQPAVQKIATAIINSSTSLTVGFTTPFSGSPAATNRVIISA